jgi:hypothetical protein
LSSPLLRPPGSVVLRTGQRTLCGRGLPDGLRALSCPIGASPNGALVRRRHSLRSRAGSAGAGSATNCDGHADRHPADYGNVTLCAADRDRRSGSAPIIVWGTRTDAVCGSTHPRCLDRLCFAVLSVRIQQNIACRQRRREQDIAYLLARTASQPLMPSPRNTLSSAHLCGRKPKADAPVAPNLWLRRKFVAEEG